MHKEARERIRLNYQWCKMQFGARAARRFYDRVTREAAFLLDFPCLGTEEKSLSDMGQPYRSIRIPPHFRLIYYADEPRDELHVVDFWDTRRDPNQLTINSIDD